MTRIVAISNEKGGVAKTTTAVSLGGALVEMEYEVLLVDLDPQANLSLSLGITPEHVRRSIADILLNSSTPISISRETSIPGLDLIPSNSEMGMAERFLPIRQNYKFLLKEALSSMHHYDIIILDCPPSLGVITINALVAADLVIIPTLAEYFSTYALKNVMGLMRSLRTNENPTLEFKLLITMLDVRLGSHKTLTKQLKATFGKSVFESIIQIDTKFRESTIIGMPITHYVPYTRGSKQYRALAKELTKYVQTE
jgi:chromosome partitioning protein